MKLDNLGAAAGTSQGGRTIKPASGNAATSGSAQLVEELIQAGMSADQVISGTDLTEELLRDEALTATPQMPAYLLYPQSTSEVTRILQLADEQVVPVTARGSGTGMCGACIAQPGGVTVSFQRMNQIIEIDTENHIAVVQPGVTLRELDEATAKVGLVYPIFPGELSASLGGNIATNAGGMRAIKYGVTRNQVLGLEVVLPGGKVVRTGGKFVKCSSGYDLTQLIIGSEGTLGLVTEIILKLYPRPASNATVLAPFSTLDEITNAVPKIVTSGVNPLILEYIDILTMAATTDNVGLDLGIPPDVKDRALAYLLVVVEGNTSERVDEDIERLAGLLGDLGAMDIYVLPVGTAAKLIDAREKAFWVAKQHGANDILDVVVPRASVPRYMQRVSEIATSTESLIAGCGHVGDGNVHLSVFQGNPDRLHEAMEAVLAAGMDLGGAVSAEHGIGREKKAYFNSLEDPLKIELMRSIKAAFDPNGILNPGAIFD